MKTVLLTGAGGFVGRTAIMPLLARGFTVHAVTSRPSVEHPLLTYHTADLLDRDETERLLQRVGASHLLHFAWHVEHGKFWHAAENTLWLQASTELLESFVAHGGKRVVMAGTCAEYDWQGTDACLSEGDSKLDPQTVYGKAKLELYFRLKDHAEKSGISYAWGRIFFLFGQFEPSNRFVPSIIRALLNNSVAETSHGEQIRDYIYVEDAGEAFVKLLDSDVQDAVNIADGTPLKLKDIAAMLAEIIGEPQLLKLGARAALKKEPARLVADVKRLRDEVKYEKQADLNTALEKTIAWWKTHK